MNKKSREPREIDLGQERRVCLRFSDSGQLFLMEWQPLKPAREEKEYEIDISKANDFRQQCIQHLNDYPSVLRDWLKHNYDIEEFQDLCQDLQYRFQNTKFKFDDLIGDGLNKARSLADRVKKYKKMPDFIKYLEEQDQHLLEDLEETIKYSLQIAQPKRDGSQKAMRRT